MLNKKNQEKYDEAIKNYNKALVLKPKFKEAEQAKVISKSRDETQKAEKS